jgi:DNA-binding PadR family transcriptional regulator
MMNKGCCNCGPFRVNLIPQGLLKPLILRLLLQRPMHGFEIMEQIYERTNGMWRPAPAAVYPALSWLESKGYIEEIETDAQGQKGRRPFKITQKGREALGDFEKFRDEWLDGISRLKKIWF